MLVMPANATGWFWHCLARETGRIGHLYSPEAQRGPWPWFPYALDNGAFSCWDRSTNTFNHTKWESTERAWRRLLVWAQSAPQKPRWVVVPDVPGNSALTLEKWAIMAPQVRALGFSVALAVQDGMTPSDVHALDVAPDLIAVGGTTEWKWATAELWASSFSRAHLLRCNSPAKLAWLEAVGFESCDGTGWNRGDRNQTRGLESWARSRPAPTGSELWPHVCRQPKCKHQTSFA